MLEANKKELFIVAFVKFAEMWACNNIGNDIEVDIPKLVRYANSDKFYLRDFWDVDTLEDCYKMIEEQILAGMPIWEFFIIPEWTRKMLDLSFNQEIADEEAERKKKYVCLQGCKYFTERHTSLGMLYKCSEQVGKKFGERYVFELQKKCKKMETSEGKSE